MFVELDVLETLIFVKKQGLTYTLSSCPNMRICIAAMHLLPCKVEITNRNYFQIPNFSKAQSDFNSSN